MVRTTTGETIASLEKLNNELKFAGKNTENEPVFSTCRKVILKRHFILSDREANNYMHTDIS